MSKFDGFVFYWHKDDKLEGLIFSHVGNFLWGGTKNFEKNCINVLKKASQEEFENLKYLGLVIELNKILYTLYQQMYISEFKKFGSVKREVSKEIPLNTEKARQLRGLVGELIWRSTQTIPDMSYGACEVTVSVADARISDLAIANKYTRN